jgi:hypothetical protein
VKTWQTDDPVYVEDLNELVALGNLTFSSTAARDSFLVGDLAPIQGTVAHVINDITYRRITVAGTSYWAPLPGTLICGMTYSSSNSAYLNMNGSGVPTQVPLTYAKFRNLNNAWSTSTYQFTPTIPGFYELDGRAFIYNANTDGYRACWLSLNGASVATAIPGSWNQLYPVGAEGNSRFTVMTRTVCRYFNGTDGSYVTLMAMHNMASGTIQLATTGDYTGVPYDCSFTAKYLGM